MTTSHTTSGFTLVETLIAISILLVSVVTPLVGVSQALTSSYLARDEITGFYLAQDAIEYIRNIRDTNALSGNDWLEGISECPDTNPCRIDTLAGSITNGSGSVNYGLAYDQGTYSNATGDLNEDVKFHRKIVTKTFDGNDHELQIIVDVWWQASSGEKHFIATENIFDWARASQP